MISTGLEGGLFLCYTLFFESVVEAESIEALRQELDCYLNMIYNNLLVTSRLTLTLQ